MTKFREQISGFSKMKKICLIIMVLTVNIWLQDFSFELQRADNNDSQQNAKHLSES